MRKQFVLTSTILLLVTVALAVFKSVDWYAVVAIMVLLTVLGYYDMYQKRHTIMRIYPVLGRLRYFMKELRPKVYQYFIESDTDGRPINRIDRSTIYQRAKQDTDTMPFGTQNDVYAEGY